MKTIYRPSKEDILDGLKLLGLVVFIFAAWILLLWATSSPANAQSVTRQGKIFIQQSNSNKIEKDTATLTGYYYQTADGTKYPIYISSKGKCFILRTSSKTGKQYKQYLPEITKQLAKK